MVRSPFVCARVRTELLPGTTIIILSTTQTQLFCTQYVNVVLIQVAT